MRARRAVIDRRLLELLLSCGFATSAPLLAPPPTPLMATSTPRAFLANG
jgi:hypothetical protein